MKNHVRFYAALLATLTLASALSACGDTAAEQPKETEKTGETAAVTDAAEATDALSQRQLVSDDLPESDFGGKEFRIFYQKRYTTDAISNSEEETGDLVDDAVLARNRSIEERFNTEIVGIEGEEDAMVKTLMKSVAAGDDAYELFLGHSISSGQAALKGCFRNWYDMPLMDFTKPWFPQETVAGLTINGKMFMTLSDMCISFISNTYGLFFNKQIAANYDLEDLYTLVESGKWTIDKLSEMTKNVYSDVNGDGKKTADDSFGFVSYITNYTVPWIYAMDCETVRFGEDGVASSVFATERSAEMLEKIRTLYLDNAGSYCNDTDDMNAMFRSGQALFECTVVGDAESDFRDVVFDYGIIPIPKFDEAQETYKTVPGGSVSCVSVPTTVSDLTFVSTVTTALCRESYVSVLPTYYDIVLKVKGARDEKSIEMLDIIMDGRSVDATFLYDGFNGYVYKFSQLITQNKDIASFCASNDKTVIKYYQKVLDLFYTNAE